MTLNFQNKILFPAPETSYTTKSAYGQIIYIPRTIMADVNLKYDQIKYGDEPYTPPPEH
jgi:hypothetical protein